MSSSLFSIEILGKWRQMKSIKEFLNIIFTDRFAILTVNRDVQVHAKFIRMSKLTCLIDENFDFTKNNRFS